MSDLWLFVNTYCVIQYLQCMEFVFIRTQSERMADDLDIQKSYVNGMMNINRECLHIVTCKINRKKL